MREATFIELEIVYTKTAPAVYGVLSSCYCSMLNAHALW